MILSKVMNYIDSGDIMREESLCQSLCPIPPLIENDKYDEAFFRVGSTGAAVSLHSSVALIYYYCSKLPSDMLVKVYSLTFTRITYIKICICMCVYRGEREREREAFPIFSFPFTSCVYMFLLLAPANHFLHVLGILNLHQDLK